MEIPWEVVSDGRGLVVRLRDAGGNVIRECDRAMTCGDVATLLGKSRRHVYRYLAAGMLPSLGKFLGEWLFDADEVSRFRDILRQGRIPMRRPALSPRFQAFFPEYNLEEMNPWLNAPVVISRLLDTGGRMDWKWVFRNYPPRFVYAMVRRHGHRLMSARSAYFWRWFLEPDFKHHSKPA